LRQAIISPIGWLTVVTVSRSLTVDAAGDLDIALSAAADLIIIIDAVIGYKPRGAPQDGAAWLIRPVKA
jgi:hypothetical protein